MEAKNVAKTTEITILSAPELFCEPLKLYESVRNCSERREEVQKDLYKLY